MTLGIILGSTREGRVTDRLANWVKTAAEQDSDVEVELLDLRDYDMPLFDEPASPRFNPDRQLNPVVKNWLIKLNQKDAFVIVTPEYNHGIPAVLKNAIDYIDWQINKKPVGIVSHGSTGGARATSSLKITISEARAVVISINVALTFGVGENFDETGKFIGDLSRLGRDPNETLQVMLHELKWYSDALAAARNKQ